MPPNGILLPVNPLPGVETNGLLVNTSLVPSWVTGCKLLATWLHTGYPVTGYLVTGCWLRTRLLVTCREADWPAGWQANRPPVNGVDCEMKTNTQAHTHTDTRNVA